MGPIGIVLNPGNRLIGCSLRLAGLVLLAIVAPVVVSEAWAQTVPDDFVITLERSCSADCPIYKVSIDARGNIEFEGIEFTRVRGRQTAEIPPSLVADLFKTVQRIGFFELRNRYVSIPNRDGSETIVTHPLPVLVTVTANGKSKRIENQLGGPKGLAELERQIDETAGTSRWTRLDEPTLRQLVKEGWKPSAEERATLLRKAIEDDDVGVVKGLIAIGADPNGAYFEERSTPLMFVRSAAMVRVLLESGALASTKSVSGITPLNTATLLAPDAFRGGLRHDHRLAHQGDLKSHDRTVASVASRLPRRDVRDQIDDVTVAEIGDDRFHQR